MDVRKFIKVDDRVVVIANWQFYVMLEEDIDEWCWQTFSYHPREGMVLTFRNEADINMFLLRWE